MRAGMTRQRHPSPNHTNGEVRMAALNLAGRRFGRLVVIERGPRTPKNSVWRCRCDCGKEHLAKGGNLNSGSTTSCGCFRLEESSRRNGKHWLSADCTTTTPEQALLYKVWLGMRRRCLYPASANYRLYGARGIGIGAEWAEYPAFYEWAMANGYAPGLSIDRIDVNGDYSPSNCRWADQKTQQRNRRNTRRVIVNGETRVLKELTERFGVPHQQTITALARGVPPERAMARLIAAMGGRWERGQIITRDGAEFDDKTEVN